MSLGQKMYYIVHSDPLFFLNSEGRKKGRLSFSHHYVKYQMVMPLKLCIKDNPTENV